jgi:hypothetical protein
MIATAPIRSTGFTRDRYFGKEIRPWSEDQIRTSAPSVFADSPWMKMSGRYKFVPTIEVCRWLGDVGFLPVKAMQSRSRTEGKAEFTKHMIRFRHQDQLDVEVQRVGQEFPEITLVNSHDGTACYQLYPSIYRAICTNGLIVHGEDLDGISVRHKGGKEFHQEIIDATYRLIEETPQTFRQVETFKQIELTAPQREVFGKAALELQASETLEPRHILAARRSEDSNPSLWSTLNTVQENLVKGGVRARNLNTGRRITTKGINSVDGDVKTNRALWRLAEEMAKLVN